MTPGRVRAVLGLLALCVTVLALLQLPFAFHPTRTGVLARWEMVLLPVAYALSAVVVSARSARPAWQLLAVGALLLALPLSGSREPLLFTLAYVLEISFVPVLVWTLLGFPDGRLTRTAHRPLVAATAVGAGVPSLGALFYEPVDFGCPDCPSGLNLLLVRSDPDVVGQLSLWPSRLMLVSLVVLGTVLVRRWWKSPGPRRRVHGPLLLPAAGWVGSYAAYLASQALSRTRLYDVPTVAYEVFAELLLLSLLLLPVTFLLGVARSRRRTAAVDDLVLALAEGPPGGELQGVLARTLGDAGLRLGMWSPASWTYVAADGTPVELPEGPGRATTYLEDDDHGPLAVLVHDDCLLDEPRMLQPVVTATRLALLSEQLRETVRRQLDDVSASRARVVQAADSERRRLERHLHDGAQARLVSLAYALETTRTQLPPDAGVELQEALASAQTHARSAIAELRLLSRGILPPSLADEGLAAAVDALTEVLPTHVEVKEMPDRRMPTAVESAAYYVVSEALANAVKHAPGATVTVRAVLLDQTLQVVVQDGGPGGAHEVPGGGIAGLRDRVEALGGRLSVTSEAGEGTRVTVEIPCAS